MGGEAGQALSGVAQIGAGFAARMAEDKMQQQMQQRAQQAQFTVQGAQQLAKQGRLDLLAPEMRKGVEKYTGKEGMQLLENINQRNKILERLRLGAEQTVGQVQETQQVPVDPSQLQPTTEFGQQVAAMQPQTGVEFAQAEMSPISEPQQVQRQATPQEAFENFNRIGPLGVSLLTGDVQMGQLAQQQAVLAQNIAEFSTEPIRRQAKAIRDTQAKLAEQGRQSQVVTASQAEQLIANGLVPQGFTPFIVGNQALLIEDQLGLDIPTAVQGELAAMGVRNIDDATPKQFVEANRRVQMQQLQAAGIRGAEAARIANEAKLNSPITMSSPQTALRMYNKQTGRQIDATITWRDIQENKKEFKQLTTQQANAIDTIRQQRDSFSAVMQKMQNLFGKSGLLNAGKGLRGRAKATFTAAINQLTQEDPIFAATLDQMGQIAQALSRNSFGGVGTQTEQDRLYAIDALTDLSATSGLIDSPDVVQQKFNDIMERFDRIEKTILDNPNYVPRGTVRLDVKKSANATLEPLRDPERTQIQQPRPAPEAPPEPQQPTEVAQPAQPTIETQTRTGQISQEQIGPLAKSLGVSEDEIRATIEQFPDVTVEEIKQVLQPISEQTGQKKNK